MEYQLSFFETKLQPPPIYTRKNGGFLGSDGLYNPNIFTEPLNFMFGSYSIVKYESLIEGSLVDCFNLLFLKFH